MMMVESMVRMRSQNERNVTIMINYCRSPTQPRLYSIRDKSVGWTTPNPPHHPTHTQPSQTFMALPGNLGSWLLVCNLILTQLDEIWRTIFIKTKLAEINWRHELLTEKCPSWKCKISRIASHFKLVLFYLHYWDVFIYNYLNIFALCKLL